MNPIKKKITEAGKLFYQFYINVLYRNIDIPKVDDLITSETSSIHWKELDINGATVLDLGCGLWDMSDLTESSPVYFKTKGAFRIVGIDANEKDIRTLTEYFQSTFPDDQSIFLHKKIESSSDLQYLIKTYDIQVIKSDIEGFEKHFFPLTREDMAGVRQISIEYHSQPILLQLLFHLNRWGFDIEHHSLFNYTTPTIGVLTARKTSRQG